MIKKTTKLFYTVLLIGLNVIACTKKQAIHSPKMDIAKRQTGALKNVLLIGLDGVTYRVLNAEMQKGNLPHLQRLQNQGLSIPAMIQTGNATSSMPGWGTILTGFWSTAHGGTNWWGPVPFTKLTLAGASKQLNLGIQNTVITQGWTNKSPAFDFAKVFLKESDGKNYTDFFRQFEVYTEGGVSAPKDYPLDKVSIASANLTVEKLKTLAKDEPHFLFSYLHDSDEIGHAVGYGDKYNKALHKLDSLIGLMTNAVETRMDNADWLILVTTDHGRVASNGMGHGGNSLEERTSFLIANQKITQKTEIELTEVFWLVLSQLAQNPVGLLCKIAEGTENAQLSVRIDANKVYINNTKPGFGLGFTWGDAKLMNRYTVSENTEKKYQFTTENAFGAKTELPLNDVHSVTKRNFEGITTVLYAKEEQFVHLANIRESSSYAQLTIKIDYRNNKVYIDNTTPGFGLSFGDNQYTITDHAGKTYIFSSRTAFGASTEIPLSGVRRIEKKSNNNSITIIY